MNNRYATRITAAAGAGVMLFAAAVAAEGSLGQPMAKLAGGSQPANARVVSITSPLPSVTPIPLPSATASNTPTPGMSASPSPSPSLWPSPSPPPSRGDR